ncbi:MAG: Phosphoribosylglycinamide formyltransferase [Calditrichaeota bacterium]|nr:Phosphoribosylglycinamide formyltransferase [Calditrichota bacterium]
MKRPVGIGIFASGRGSNARALFDACRRGELDARVVIVISNDADAGVHEFAREFGVSSRTIRRDEFADGAQFAETLIGTLREAGADLICLAGYMRKIPPALIRAYPRAILNIHPAPLPKFGGKGMYGLRVHAAVIDAGDAETGVTVHYVDEHYDTGAILHQRSGIPVRADDTPEALAARVLTVEHETYPEAVRKWIERHARTGGEADE